MDNKKVYNKLPEVFQNVTQRKFFDSTFEQLFSKKNSEKIDGYIGRRTSGIYDPLNDYYIPQKNKERTWYQLEPSAVVENPETSEKSNYYFYYDLINRIKSLGGRTDNHDRLFQSNQYSYAPPIDMDKFVNFQNYYWMPSKFDPIELVNIPDYFIEGQIIGNDTFIASGYSEFVGTEFEDLVFTSGLRVTFPDSESYNKSYTVEGVGNSIRLVEDELEILPAVTYNSLPWDADASVGTVSLDNSMWDSAPWDSVERETTLADYITIGRGSLNSNLWSRTNKWYHISAIEETIRFTGKSFPASAERARRPIIEFFTDLQLEDSGTFFYNEIDFYQTDLTYGDVNGRPVNEVKEMFNSSNIKNGTKILFPNDDSAFQGVGSVVNTIVWQVFVLNGIVYLVPANYNIVNPIPVELFYQRLPWDSAGPSIDNTLWDQLSWSAVELTDEQGVKRLLEVGGNFVYDNATVRLPSQEGLPIGTEVRVRVLQGTTSRIEAFDQTEIMFDLNGIQSTEVVYSDSTQDVGFILTENGWESFTIISYAGVAEVDDIVFVVSGIFPAEGGNLGQSYYFDGSSWILATNQKVRQNQQPLFSLYDNSKISVSDINKYPDNNFNGSEIFSFKVSDETDATPDPILGFPLVYKSFAQSSDIVFENDLVTERYTYLSDDNGIEEIPGYYYYRVVSADDNRLDSTKWNFSNSWYLIEEKTQQRVVDKFAVFDENDNEFPLSVNPISGTDTIDVTLNGTNIEDFEYFFKNGDPWIRVNRVLERNDDIETRTYSFDSLSEDAPGYYEIPNELESNAENSEVAEYSYGEFVPHFTSIIFNQDGNQVNPRSRENIYRDTSRDPSRGNLIVQTDSSMLKAMLFSDNREIDVISAIRYVKNEYNNFRNTFVSAASRYKYKFEQDDNFTVYNWISDVIESSGLARRTAGAFENSFMVAYGDPTAEENFAIDTLRNNGNPTSVLLTNVGPGQFRTILDAELPGIIHEYNKVELYDNDQDRTLELGLDYSIERTERSAIIRFNENSGVTTDGLVSVDLLSKTAQLTSSVTDVTQQNNIMYVYEVGSDFEVNSGTEQKILLESTDYFVRYEDGLINIDFPYESNYPKNDKLYYARIFADSDPAYIPSTPAKLGMSKVYKPRLEIDTSYSIEQAVIVGHDGSKTIAYGNYERDSNDDLVPDDNGAPYPTGLDISGGIDNVPLTELTKYYDVRDLLLLELEKQIYNNIPSKFKNEYDLLLKEEDIRPSALMLNDYNRLEYYQLVTESLFSKWTADNNLDFRKNEFYTPLDWRTWNYSSLNKKLWDQTTNEVVEVDADKLPGSWKGIYVYYYGTIEPHKKPWECLGFAEEPSWWRETTEAGYNDGFVGYGNDFSSTNTAMWADIEQGIVRRGPRAGVLLENQKLGLLGNCDFDRNVYYQELADGTRTFRQPYTGVAGSDNLIPVYDNQEKKTIVDIFGYNTSDVVNPSKGWVYGDGGPVENAWYRSPEFFFSLIEFFYLLKPAAFGEKLWDPESIDFIDEQFIDTRTGFRPVNANQLVHGEVIDGETVIRSGYQQYISDYLIFNNLNVTNTVGNKVRGLKVNLAHKIGGFTNRDRIKLYLESVTDTDNGSLLLPSNNFDVALYTGSPIKSYNYSGVLINVNEDASFTIYGYDLNAQEFKILPAKQNSREVRVEEGGTPASFREFEFDKAYTEGEIVRYQGNFYRARASFVASSFVSSEWVRLSGLPTTGGIKVVYRPDRQDTFKRVVYGTRFSTAQEVYDFLIGYGAYLESEGWKYDTVDIYGKVDNWKTAASKFLFWASNNWETNNALALSPNSTQLKLELEDGYPDNIETVSNGVYSILDKDGFSIPTEDTIIQRDNREVTVIPANEGQGVFYLRVNAIETEHILVVDKITDFNDIIYDPVLNTRQSRLRFSGTRTLGWTGKLEAPGFLVQGKELIPNLETITENIRTLYDENTVNDNEDFEDAARHLIGYEGRSYLDTIGVSDQTQYSFYQGFVTEKGSANSVNKLLRSSSLKDKDKISFYEDWAFKSSDFGGSTNDISIEVLSERGKVKSDPQIYRLNYNLEDTGYVSSIELYSAEELYSAPPEVTIEPPEGNGVQARAVAILNSTTRQIERIEVVNRGSGYNSRPAVTIDKSNLIIRNDSTYVNNVLVNTDTAYVTIQREINEDSLLDQIIDIDSDDKERWLKKPDGINFGNSVPTITKIENGLPTAGYVNFNDVNFSVYSDISPLWSKRLTDRPTHNNSIWVASNPVSDWSVYKLSMLANVDSGNIIEGNDSEAVLDSTDETTYFSSFDENSFIANRKRYPDCKFGYDSNTDAYTIDEFSVSVELTNPDDPSVPFRNELSDRFLARAIKTDLGYQLKDINGDLIEYTKFEHESGLPFQVSISILVNMRFSNVSAIDSYTGDEFENGDLVWVDGEDNNWSVMTFNSSGTTEVYRKVQPFIDTSLYDNVFLRDRRSGNTIAQLPVYDPVKGILFGSVEKNVSYKTPSDPAYYNDAIQGRTFGPDEIGKVWLDTSSIKFVDYEQPPKYQELLGSNRQQAINNAIVYRRDHWGKVFPGSPIDVYEWVESPTPPSNYRGNGIPKNNTDFIEERKYNAASNDFEVKYYFWVKNKTEFPNNAKNRTMSTTEIANTIRNPGKQGIKWFAPIQYSATNQSIIIANADNILSNRNSVVQLNYKQSESDNIKHDEWLLLRENDRFSPIPERLWNKMVDSLIGFTQPLPIGIYENGIPVNNNEVVLPVPDTRLSEDQRYGLGVRPQQSMFVDSREARKIIVNKVNDMISGLRFWETPLLGWDENIESSSYWEYVDWYAEGYNRLNTRTNRQVESLQDLLAITNTLENGDLVRVYPFSPNLLIDKFEVYVYDETIGNVRLVRREDGSVKIKDSIIDSETSSVAKREFRQLLTALKENVFVSTREVLQNVLFFTAVNYAFSEQKNIDWAFKTSYITFVQDGISLDQEKFYQPDLFDDFLDYVREAKPYHTKIRDSIIIITYESPDEVANGTAYDNFIGDYSCENGVCSGSVDTYLRTMKISIEFDRFGENHLVIDPESNGSADPSRVWDKVGTLWDQEGYLWDQSKIVGGVVDSSSGSSTVYNSESSTDELVYIDPAETIIIDTSTDVVANANDYWDINTWDSANGFDEQPELFNSQDVSYKMHIRKYGIEYGEFTANAEDTSAELLSYLPPSRYVPQATVTGDGISAEIYIKSLDANGGITELEIANGGFLYNTAEISIDHPYGTGFNATLVIENGAVTDYTINSAGSGYSITFDNGKVNQIEITKVPSFISVSIENQMWIGTELITYSSVTDTGNTLILTGVQRGQKGTGIQEHNIGDMVFTGSDFLPDPLLTENGVPGADAYLTNDDQYAVITRTFDNKVVKIPNCNPWFRRSREDNSRFVANSATANYLFLNGNGTYPGFG